MKYNKNIQNFNLVSNFGNQFQVRVGIVEKQTHAPSGLDMAYLQTIHHYGSIEQNIPARDVLVEPTRRKKDVIYSRIDQATTKNIAEEKFAEIVGEAVLQEAVLETFRTGEGLPLNKPKTIAKKGSQSPLIDTGDLMRAQAWKIVKKS